MRTTEYCPALFHLPPLVLWNIKLPFFYCGEADIQTCIRAADPNRRRRSAGSINAPSDCAPRNASAACPGPRLAGLLSGPNMRQPLGYATVFNEQNHRRYPDLKSSLTQSRRQLESSLNTTIKQSSTYWNGIWLQRASCVPMIYIFTWQFVA